MTSLAGRTERPPVGSAPPLVRAVCSLMEDIEMKKPARFRVVLAVVVGLLTAGLICSTFLVAEAPVVPASIEQAKTSAEKDAFRQRLLRDLEQYARTHATMNVPRTDGEFLRILAEGCKVKRGLEIGSSNGYSAIWIGMGLEKTGGKLVTVEIDRNRAQMCKENLKKAGLDKIVESVEGDALKVIPKLEGPFDFVFIDALKEDYKRYLDMVMRKMPVGGVIAAHNAIQSANSMRDYLDAVGTDPRFDTVILSTTMRDGFAITYNKAQ